MGINTAMPETRVERQWRCCLCMETLFQFYKGKGGERRAWRLMCCAYAWRHWSILKKKPGKRAAKTLRIAEQYADGGVTARELNEARRSAEQECQRHIECTTKYDSALATWRTVAIDPEWSLDRMIRQWSTLYGSLNYTMCRIFRDLFGNPFKPLALRLTCPECGKEASPGGSSTRRCIPCNQRFASPWFTPTVVDLAHAAYGAQQEKDGTLDPVRLKILSDALEEARLRQRGFPPVVSPRVSNLSRPADARRHSRQAMNDLRSAISKRISQHQTRTRIRRMHLKNLPRPLKRFAHLIQDVSDERSANGDGGNGYWVYLVPGWTHDGCHCIHEDTPADCADLISCVEPCTLTDCCKADCDSAEKKKKQKSF